MRSDRELVGYAMGLLEPGDALALQESLPGDPGACLQVAGISALEDRPSPGPAAPSPALSCQPAQTLAAGEAPGIGERVILRLRPGLPAAQARCVLFREAGGERQLIHPQPGRTWPTLDRFRAEGRLRLLDLVLAPPAGEQRFTVVLVPAGIFEDCWPAEDERWERLRAAAQRGDLPAQVVQLQVAEG